MNIYVVLIVIIAAVKCDNDTEVLELVNKFELLELARNITLKVLDPDKIQQPYRLKQTPAEAFIIDIYRYHNRLNSIFMMMLSDNDDGEKVFLYIYNHDGPEHLSLHLDYHYLTNYYNFTEIEVAEIKEMLEYTKNLWLKMCDKLHKEREGTTEKAKVLDIEESLSKLELIPLGKNITRKISAKVKVNNKTISDLFLNDIYKYKNRLDSVIFMVKGNNSKGTIIYNHLLEEGGPPHIKMKINYDEVQNIYDFNDEEIDDMGLLINKTRTNWEELVLLPKATGSASWW